MMTDSDAGGHCNHVQHGQECGKIPGHRAEDSSRTGPQPAAPSESEQYHLLCLSIKELGTMAAPLQELKRTEYGDLSAWGEKVWP